VPPNLDGMVDMASVGMASTSMAEEEENASEVPMALVELESSTEQYEYLHLVVEPSSEVSVFALGLVETLDTSHLADLSNGSLASHTCSKDDRKLAWT